MQQNLYRNELIVSLAEREVKAGHQVLVFSHRREHCYSLDAYLTGRGTKSGVLLGGDESAERFRETIAGIKDGTVRVAVGTVQAIGQGLDLPSVSRGIVTTPIVANRQLWGQVRGRLCRTSEGKDDAIVFVLWDRHVVGSAMVRNLCKWNRDVKVLSGDDWVAGKRYLEVLDGEEKEDGWFK